MKTIYILEHANWDYQNNRITNKSEQECLSLQRTFKSFDRVISSREQRSKETAFLLTGIQPVLDSRAGTIQKAKRKKHLGIGHGHVRQKNEQSMTSTPLLFRTPDSKAGARLLALVKSTFNALPENGKALIISHNQPMIALKKQLSGEQYLRQEERFASLEGFRLNERMKLAETRQ